MRPTLSVGDEVRIERDETRFPAKGTWSLYRGRVGTLVEVNEGEYAVVFGKVQRRPDGSLDGAGKAWFAAHEVVAADAPRTVAAAPGATPRGPEHHPTPPRPSDSRAATANAICCGGCGATWTGLAACHCSGCHVTFSGLTLFDAHRRGGRCHDPAAMTYRGEPLVHRDGIWHGAAMTEQEKLRAKQPKRRSA